MPAFCIAFPVLQGKSQRVKEFGGVVTGPKSSEFASSEKRLGITKEAWFLQKSSQGDQVLIYFESPDPLESLMQFVESKDPFDLWFKNETKELTGIDLNQPPSGEPPEAVIRYGY